MPCLPRIELRWLFQLALSLLLAVPCLAGEIRLTQSQASEEQGAYTLDARFVVDLDPVHEQALLSGVPLTFAIEFTLTHPRWYWAWRRLADWFNPTERIEHRLSYHALTRQYRVGIGSLYLGFDTLHEALGAIGVVREWMVFERGPLTRRFNSALGGDLIMRLDTTRLPKPMQFSLFGESDWRLESSVTAIVFPESD